MVVDHNAALFERARAELSGVSGLESTSLRGAHGSRNTGACHARSVLIAFLDDDTVAHPGWLGHIASQFSDRASSCVGGRIRPTWEHHAPAWMPDELLW